MGFVSKFKNSYSGKNSLIHLKAFLKSSHLPVSSFNEFLTTKMKFIFSAACLRYTYYFFTIIPFLVILSGIIWYSYMNFTFGEVKSNSILFNLEGATEEAMVVSILFETGFFLLLAYITTFLMAILLLIGKAILLDKAVKETDWKAEKIYFFAFFTSFTLFYLPWIGDVLDAYIFFIID